MQESVSTNDTPKRKTRRSYTSIEKALDVERAKVSALDQHIAMLVRIPVLIDH